jgi:hypothetical protein
MERTLKNGSTANETVVHIITESLVIIGNLGTPGLITLADLHEKFLRNPGYEMHPNSVKILQKLSLVRNGVFDDSVIGVVQSCLIEDRINFSITIVSPYAD